MAGWNGGRKSPRVTQKVHGYTLRGRAGRVRYVGITNNPGRRAEEHPASPSAPFCDRITAGQQDDRVVLKFFSLV